jgi:GTPase SAR1 family protein
MRSVWGEDQPFGLTADDRRQHLLVIGKSGVGKTTLLRNLLVQDIEAGRGVCLIDVHGDLSEELLDLIPPHRADDIVYFRPGEAAHPIGLNLLHDVPPEKRYIVASNVVGAFKSIWRQSWGVRMEYVLFAAISALLECPGTTLLGLQRIFLDSAYRHWVTRQVTDPVVNSFWTYEFASWDTRLRNEIVGPVLNKVGALLITPDLRNVLGQVKRKIDFRFMMDKKRILIANIRKAELGEDKAGLLGSLIISAFQQAALGRADLPEAERNQFTLYIDEFQSFQTDSFKTILSEARKYGLSLVLSHQFASQLLPEVSDAVFGNVGSIVAFRVGSSDAERLAREFGPPYTARHFTELPNHHVLVRLLRDGDVGEPFYGRTLPPLGQFYQKSENITRRSEEKYGVPRNKVEDKIQRWFRSSMY